MESFELPEEWWGPGFWWGQGEPRSVLELMAGGTLDARLAALLWLAVHRHTSLVVVGGHTRGAGKTTLLTALMAFLAPGVTPVFTIGRGETFAFAGHTDPARTRIMVNELSDHLPVYLWGRAAARVFDLAGQGYALATTMHAESLDELVGQTEQPPVGVSPRTFAERMPLAVLLAAGRQGNRIVRRVTGVLHLRPGADGGPAVYADSLSSWNPDTDSFRFTEGEEAWSALAGRLGLPLSEFQRDWEARQGYLAALVKESDQDYDVVRAAILRYQ